MLSRELSTLAEAENFKNDITSIPSFTKSGDHCRHLPYLRFLNNYINFLFYNFETGRDNMESEAHRLWETTSATFTRDLSWL